MVCFRPDSCGVKGPTRYSHSLTTHISLHLRLVCILAFSFQPYKILSRFFLPGIFILEHSAICLLRVLNAHSTMGDERAKSSSTTDTVMSAQPTIQVFRLRALPAEIQLEIYRHAWTFAPIRQGQNPQRDIRASVCGGPHSFQVQEQLSTIKSMAAVCYRMQNQVYAEFRVFLSHPSLHIHQSAFYCQRKARLLRLKDPHRTIRAPESTPPARVSRVVPKICRISHVYIRSDQGTHAG